MLVNDQNWKECDWCQQEVPCEFGHVAQGASGRWCVVMSCCAKCAEGKTVTDIDDARAYADANGWADF